MDDRILIVDDEPAELKVLERLLQQAGYRAIRCTEDSRQVLSLGLTFQPDIVLLDLHMPHLDGFEVMEQLAVRTKKETHLPILVLTGDLSPETRRRALEVGASDFVTKPFDSIEVLQRVKNLLLTRRLYLELQRENRTLEQRVEERTRDLEQVQLGALKSLALVGEFRDDQTGQHAERVGVLSAALARELRLPDTDVRLIRHAAPLHDVGKISLPDAILKKPSELNRDEIEQMNRHTTIGAMILSAGHSPLLEYAEVIALTHHERYDGTGYPTGLAGEDIPLPGRIVGVADAFDAMTHARPYRKFVLSVDEAVIRIDGLGGRQFDPQVTRALGALLPTLHELI